jgi:hypothetical protein
VNTLMNFRVPLNAGKFFSSCTIGGFWRRAQLHEWVSEWVVLTVYVYNKKFSISKTEVSKHKFIFPVERNRWHTHTERDIWFSLKANMSPSLHHANVPYCFRETLRDEIRNAEYIWVFTPIHACTCVYVCTCERNRPFRLQLKVNKETMKTTKNHGEW